jgi:hypothetical protein
VHVLLASALGVSAALLVSCASSGKGLIPVGNAGPLQADFTAIEQDARSGSGSCSATEAAIARTESDFGALPSSVDQGLRSRLREGITNLRGHALEVCAQPLPQATVTTTAPRSTPSTQTTPTTPTSTETTPTQTTPTTTTTTSGPGGGTPAPGEESPPEGAGKDRGNGRGQGDAGGAEPGAGGEGNGQGKGK